MARPTKLTPELQDRITDLLRQGVPQEATAYSVGIAPATLYNWKARGTEGEEPFVEFLEAVEQARGEAEASMVLVVRRAALGGDVRAAQWWLDRAHPERWAQRQQIALTGAEDGPIDIEIAGWGVNGR